MWHAVFPKNVTMWIAILTRQEKKERKRGEGFAITEDEGVTILYSRV